MRHISRRLVNNIDLSEVHRIVVVKLDHIGDVVLSTPVLNTLREAFPKAYIQMVVGHWSKSVLDNNPNIDELLTYSAPWLNRELLSDKIDKYASANIETIHKLSSNRQDLVVNLRISDIHHHVFCSQFADKYFLAHETQTPFDSLVTHMSPLGPKAHVKEYHQRLIGVLGLKIEASPSIYCTKDEKVWAASILSRKTPQVAIFTGAGVPIKQWPEKNFIELCKRLNNIGLKPLILGTDSEKNLSQKAEQMAEVVNLVGMTSSLGQLAAILERVTLLVSNDSAPVHIADAMGTRTIVLTKPNSKKEFSPWNSGHSILSRRKCNWNMNCPGFVFERSESLPKRCKCLESLSVDEVEQSILKQLRDLLMSRG
jgi:ADP-heptose:LPS heptosyltransferase